MSDPRDPGRRRGRGRRRREEDYPPPLLDPDDDPGGGLGSGRTPARGQDWDTGSGRTPARGQDWDTGTGHIPARGQDWDTGTGRIPARGQDWDTGTGHIPAHARGWDTGTLNIPLRDPVRDTGTQHIPTRGEGWVRLDAPGSPQDPYDDPDPYASRYRTRSGSPGTAPAQRHPDPPSDRGAGGHVDAPAGPGPAEEQNQPRPRRRLGFALPLLLLVLLAWLSTAMVSVAHPAPLASAVALLAMLMPAVTVIGVPVLGLALVRRRWFIATVATLVVLGPWLLVLDRISPSDKPSGKTQVVRFLVVNGHDGKADAAQIVDQVRTQNADVLVVTELSGTLAHDLTANGIDATLKPASVLTASPVEAGIGVYSRFSVSGVQRVPNTHWPAVRATVDTGKGTFTLVAVHVVPPTPAGVGLWAKDLDGVGKAANAPGTVAMAGTLNATAWNPQMRELTSGRLYDATSVFGKGLRPTWPNWAPMPTVALEHVLVTGDVGVSAMSTAPVEGSDHRSLAVTLTVPQS